jgi:hypothetical protein
LNVVNPVGNVGISKYSADYTALVAFINNYSEIGDE